MSSTAAEIPVTGDRAVPAGEVATASAAGAAGEVSAAGEDDEAAGRQDAARDKGAAGRDEADELDDGAGEEDENDYFDGNEEVADDDETDGTHAPAEPIEIAEPVELDEPAAALRPRRRWTRLLLAFGFVIIAAAIVGGAIAIVGSVTHGFKKPVKVTYKKSAVFSLKTGDCLDPSGQSYTLVSCDSPHQAEVYATFALSGTKWPGEHRGRRGREQRLRDQAQRLPEPAAGGQPGVYLRVPGRDRVAGGHPHGDLRGARGRAATSPVRFAGPASAG